MRARRPWACLALLLGVLGSMPATLLSTAGLWAGSRPAPGRTTQQPASAEPPLAGQGAPPASLVPTPAAPPARSEHGTPCPEDPPPPVVSLRVRVPATAAAGQDLEYRICVENRSESPAHHVLVRNPLPANARFVRASPEPTSREPELVWQLGTLDACACREIVLVLQPTGAEDLQNCARVQFEHGQCVRTRIARPSLSVRKCGPTQAALNDVLTYQLCVTNTGSVEAEGVMLSDTLPAALEHASGRNQLTWEVGRLGPGESRSVDYQVVAKAAGRHANKAAATAGPLRVDTEHWVTIAEARIALDKTGPRQRYVNLPAAYQLTVTNAGSTPLTQVTLTDPLPEQTTFVRASHGGRLVGHQVQWTLDALDPGASRTVEVVLQAQAAGRICNRATVTAERGLTAHSEFCTQFVGVSALLLEVVDSDDPVEVGSESRYIILVRNQGTEPATNVRIQTQVPDQMAIVRVTGPADHRKEEQRISFNPLTLAPRAEARYVIYVKAHQPGLIRFKASLTADQLTSGPVNEEESTNIYADIPARLDQRP